MTHDFLMYRLHAEILPITRKIPLITKWSLYAKEKPYNTTCLSGHYMLDSFNIDYGQIN